MKKMVIFHNTLSIILVTFLTFQACKKESKGPPPTPPPLNMEVISGNDQKGYTNKELRDTIVVKVTPKNPEDLKWYSWGYRGTNIGNPLTIPSVVNGEYYLKIAWTLGPGISSQQITLLLYGDCYNQWPNCKPIDSVILRATVNSRQWTKIFDSNTFGKFYDMHFSSASEGVIVGDFSTGLLVTGNGGETWNFASSIRNDYYQLEFADEDTGLVVLTNNYIYFTHDGGKTYTAGSAAGPTVGHLTTLDYFMLDKKTIFAVGYLGNLHKSDNWGLGWTKYTGFNFINPLRSITCPDANTCYACGDVAKIIKSSDGGETWTEQPIMINHNLRKVYFIDKNFGFAVGQWGAMVRTTDGGANWTVIKTGLRFDIMEIRFFGNNLGFAVTTAGEIAKTTDGGLTWTEVVTDNFGVWDLTRAYIKDATTAFGLQNNQVFKYDLR
jgi:photosystem II stability/assembly factor-like uncharacterized protein